MPPSTICWLHDEDLEKEIEALKKESDLYEKSKRDHLDFLLESKNYRSRCYVGDVIPDLLREHTKRYVREITDEALDREIGVSLQEINHTCGDVTRFRLRVLLEEKDCRKQKQS